MKQYRTIEKNFIAQDYYTYNGPAFRNALHAAEDWIFNEAPRHNAGPVRIIARVYTESGRCRKVFTTNRNF